MSPRRILRDWMRDGFLAGLLRQCGVLVAGDVAANAISLVSLALTARALGPETFGVLVLIQTYANVVDELVNFQSWKALIKFGAGWVRSGERGRLAGLMRIGLTIDGASALVAALLAVAGSFAFAAWKGLSADVTGMLVLSSAAIVFNVAGTPTAILRLYDRFRLFSVQKTTAAAIKLVGVSVAYALGTGLWGFLIAYVVATTVGRLLLMFFGWRVLRENGVRGVLRARAEGWGEVTRFAVWTNLITTVSMPLKHFDMALVGALVSLEGVGVYKLIKQIALVMTMVSDSVYQVIYPRLAGLIAQHDWHGAARQARRTGTVLLVFTLGAATAVALFGTPVIAVVFGEAYAGDPASLSTYMFLRAFSCAFVVVHPLFLAMAYVRSELVILLVANALYLAVAWVLGSWLGLLGIVLAYGVQFTTVLAPKLWIIRRALAERSGDVTPRGEPAPGGGG